MEEEYQATEKTDTIAEEIAAYEIIKPMIVECLEQINVHNDDYISFSQYIDSKGYGYSSIFIGSQLLLRIRLRGKSKFIGIKKWYFEKFKSFLPEGYKTQGIQSDPTFERITINGAKQIPEFKGFIQECVHQLLKEMPTTFDCCSRFEECSKAKHCVNPYEELILGCSYRRKLEEGVSFL